MGLPEILYVLWSWRFLVAAIVVVLVAGAVLLGLFRERLYTAEAVVSLQPREELSPEDSETFVLEVVGAVEPEILLRDVRREIGWEDGSEDFRERLDVQPIVSRKGDPALRVRFSGSEAGEAVRVSNTYAKLFVERVEKLNDQRIAGGSLAAAARVEEVASSTESTSSPGLLLYAAGAIALGMLLGGGGALLLESRTHSWRDARDAELTLRAPVLGVIPEYPSEEA